MKTYMANAQNTTKEWYLVDADGQVYGRVASQVAAILHGKHKPTYTPHYDAGDYVIVINTDKMIVTGKKREKKIVRHHTGMVGNLKEVQLGKLLDKQSDEVLYQAIRGMLPKNSLGRAMIKKLRVYKGGEHEQVAQQPTPYALQEKRYDK
ncbi:MAG: 50S ribosomal protein L13 [Clostridiales bacterium]|jgi:large subunit ribosomal protein L13|nr:50S ribosomal protein L13 [Clostridiales bacterium]